jgi:hypothetical protein
VCSFRDCFRRRQLIVCDKLIAFCEKLSIKFIVGGALTQFRALMVGKSEAKMFIDNGDETASLSATTARRRIKTANLIITAPVSEHYSPWEQIPIKRQATARVIASAAPLFSFSVYQKFALMESESRADLSLKPNYRQQC